MPAFTESTGPVANAGQEVESIPCVMSDQSRSVYIVDDNPDVLRVLGTMLSREGWNVHAFESPTRFLGQLAELPGGVIVVDQVMGEMDGLELLQKLSDKQREYTVACGGRGKSAAAAGRGRGRTFASATPGRSLSDRSADIQGKAGHSAGLSWLEE